MRQSQPSRSGNDAGEEEEGGGVEPGGGAPGGAVTGAGPTGLGAGAAGAGTGAGAEPNKWENPPNHPGAVVGALEEGCMGAPAGTAVEAAGTDVAGTAEDGAAPTKGDVVWPGNGTGNGEWVAMEGAVATGGGTPEKIGWPSPAGVGAKGSTAAAEDCPMEGVAVAGAMSGVGAGEGKGLCTTGGTAKWVGSAAGAGAAGGAGATAGGRVTGAATGAVVARVNMPRTWVMRRWVALSRRARASRMAEVGACTDCRSRPSHWTKLSCLDDLDHMVS